MNFQLLTKLPKRKNLYWAYGSNLHIEQMKCRCPDAIPFAPLTMRKVALRFRLYADVAAHATLSCPGGLWWISEKDEWALDRYEGVSSRLYSKEYFTVKIRGQVFDVLYYKMTHKGIVPPSQGYLDTIAQGYRDFDLDLEILNKAVMHAHNKGYKTPFMQRRYVKKGRPDFAYQVSEDI